VRGQKFQNPAEPAWERGVRNWKTWTVSNANSRNPPIFRFYIRDLLWLTVVVAFAVLWCGEIRQRKVENAEVWAQNARLQEERQAAWSQRRNQRSASANIASRAKGKAKAESTARQSHKRNMG
jgi:hypothetical protein